MAAAAAQKRIIITAPTGSGKSTQVPQMLLDAGLLGSGQVVILQPRRLPTRLLATWVAQERGVQLGHEVGYQIRLDDVTSARTRIRYVTEGVLLRQMLNNSNLTGISAILFDEFHERHLYGDITLARALQIQETARPDLLIVVMSATLDVAVVKKYLEPCAVLSSKGRAYPVEIEHLPKPVGETAVWELAADELCRLTREHDGDALVFMPGSYEISRTVQAAQDALGRDFIVLPLHGELSARDQDAAVARYDRRKIVVATNVAETSLTIDGVRIVVDSGLARIARYDPHRGINTLLVEKISRASADQRAGRAGRTAPGRCVRLWTKREHEARPAQELPEVKRLDLAEVVLTLKAGGVDDVRNFRWLEPPSLKALERAEALLLDLGALHYPSPEPSPRERGEGRTSEFPRPAQRGGGQGEGRISHITELGRRMLAFPMHPRYARMMLAAQERGCVRAVALIAALTQGRNLLVRQAGRQVAESRDEFFGDEADSDFFILMRAYRYAERNGFNVERCRRLGVHAQTARQVGPLFEQFLRIAEREGLDVNERPVEREAIERCVLAGFSDHVARRLDAGTLRCALAHGRRGALSRDSVVKAPLLAAAEVAEVEGRELNVVLSLATAVKEEWLREMFPGDFVEKSEVMFDSAARRVVLERRRQFRDLVLETARNDQPPLEEAAKILAEEVLAGRCVLKQWNDDVEQWIARVNRLREWMPELGIPGIRGDDRQVMLRHICFGAASCKEIKDRPVWPVVKGWLSKQQQEWVEQFTPERVELPGGRRAKVRYAATGAPVVSARIQDLYGVQEGLFVANGRVPLVIEILAPNHRPIQVTQNLAAFWKDTYPKVKQELKRKYPKHEWK